MFKKIKSNLLVITSFLILLSILCYNSYNFIKNYNLISVKNEEAKTFCINSSYTGTEYQNYCEDILSKEDVPIDFYTMFADVTVLGFGKISFALFLFIIIPALYYPCKYFKNKAIINSSTRSEYKKVIFNVLKKAYNSVWILFGIIIISIIICFCYTKTFNPAYSTLNSTIPWSEGTTSNAIVFILAYLFNVLVHSFLYINIGLCVTRKYHNYFVAVILSFLIYISIEAFLEIAINGILFTSILKSGFGIVFNIMNMLAFNDSYGIILTIMVPFILMIVSFIFVYVLYKNKEKMIIECEKNE